MVLIATKMQESNYAINKEILSPGAMATHVHYYVLMICQLKYDLTDEKTSPEFWLSMRITDYQKLKPKFVEATNKTVEDLNLQSFLKIGV